MSRLGRRENLVLLAFSLLFTINIAVSNLSLYVANLDPLNNLARPASPLCFGADLIC